MNPQTGGFIKFGLKYEQQNIKVFCLKVNTGETSSSSFESIMFETLMFKVKNPYCSTISLPISDAFNSQEGNSKNCLCVVQLSVLHCLLVRERLSLSTHYPHPCYYSINPIFICWFQTFIVKNKGRNDEFYCCECKCGNFLMQKMVK